ncbi:hypothetical protein C84B14_08762 [Salinisphaera sp. C84B14]|uniref:hypothetical protein n=1 Tax=Salinisphaera sp. C84B14 TaxID=1304155 RepID=UPI0033418811
MSGVARRKTKHEAHVRLYRHELESEAYRTLSTDGRALLVEFRALYNGRDNRIPMSVREMRRRLNVGQVVAERARDELLERGFIRQLKLGSFSRKARHATEYALTHEPLDNGMGSVAPKDFMRWRQKNTVRMTDTDGTDDQYRGSGPKALKAAHGTDDQYREPSNDDSHGTDDQYTDKLPTVGGADWLSEHMGWRCRNGSVLNACCLICGVWITASGYEFDSGKHSCDPVSRAKYQERLRQAKDEQLAA